MKIMVVQNPTGIDAPVGAVILWFGVASAIPSGWQIYATDCMIRGTDLAGINETPIGSITHVHTNANTDEKIHSHTISQTLTFVGSGAQSALLGAQSAASESHSHTKTSICANNVHSHVIPDTSAINILPPYHRLYWIERVS